MKQSLEKRLEALEHHQEPVEYVLKWLEPGEKPDPDAIQLKWADDL